MLNHSLTTFLLKSVNVNIVLSCTYLVHFVEKCSLTLASAYGAGAGGCYFDLIFYSFLFTPITLLLMFVRITGNFDLVLQV